VKLKNVLSILSTAALLYSCELFAGQADLLQDQDINTVMQQILGQHVGQNEINKQTLKDSFTTFFEQFDPHHIYLLRGEVAPFTNMNNVDMTALLEQYKHNDYSIYKKINLVVEQAIFRARRYRKELEVDPTHLLEQTKREMNGGAPPYQLDVNGVYAKDIAELQKRIRLDVISYLQEEMQRFGIAEVMNHPQKAIDLYESNARAFENTYLFTNEAGSPLPFAQQRSLFVTHILKSLSSNLDSHTRFFDKAEAYDMKVRLEKGYEGLGLLLQQKIEGIFVSGLIPDGPAAKSGSIKVNDQIVAIDGDAVEGKNFKDVLVGLREKNTPVVALDIMRDDKPMHVQLSRGQITLNEGRVESSFEKYDNGIIGEITLHMFYQGANGVSSENDVRQAITKLKSQGNLKGLILDLRDNTGGFLTQAVQVASLFISSGVVVISKYADGSEEFFRDLEDKEAYSGPLVILTSRETASAAEIVAQSLQDYGVALIVGDEHTYGKGTIQSQNITAENTDTASPFKVTVGRYYTVSGKTPQMQGVKADIVVPSQFSFMRIGEEYLDHPIRPDSIDPDYNDQLADVSSADKGWYLKHYTPFLQHKMDTWANSLPTLKKNSATRIAQNKDYQRFLLAIKQESEEDASGKGTVSRNVPPESFDDLQMQEAVNIVKDMIALQSQKQASAAVTPASPNQ